MELCGLKPSKIIGLIGGWNPSKIGIYLWLMFATFLDNVGFTVEISMCTVSKKTTKKHTHYAYSYTHKKRSTLWLFNIAMEAIARRNRWFTY